MLSTNTSMTDRAKNVMKTSPYHTHTAGLMSKAQDQRPTLKLKAEAPRRNSRLKLQLLKHDRGLLITK